MTRRHILVIGAQRCGTTYLHDLLAGHPQIAMARPARPEPKVFLSDELSGRGRQWYVDTFFSHAGPDQLLGEKSTSYLEYADAARRARDVLGDPLILVQVRDPIARALSHWAFSTDHGFESRPAVNVLEANLEGPLPWDPAKSSVSPVAYLERGRYTDYLGPWLEEFGGDVKILLLDEMRSERDRVAELFDFLGVDSEVTPELGRTVNASAAVTPRLPDDLVHLLREYYRDSDRALAQLLGRPLTWQGTTGGRP